MSAPAQCVDVAVVGTGVVGLAAALGCAQQGLSVALIGPRPRRWVPSDDAPFDPRVYALAPASIELLESLRAWPQADAERLQAVARMRVFGDDRAELSFSAYAAAIERLATIVEESELLRILWLACGFAPALVHLEASFEALAAGSDAAVLRLGDGRDVQARLVLGADGKASAVRAAAGLNAVERPHGQTAVVAHFACERPHAAVALQWFTEEGIVALLPLPGDRVSLVWSAPEALAAGLLQLPAADLAARVRDRTGAFLGDLVRLGAAHGFGLNDLRVDRVVAPRLVLLGDAAHVVHPLAGQGLNLGLQDVSKLLEVLRAREPWRDVGDLPLLRRHERARAEPVALMRWTVNSLSRLFGTPDPALRWLRNRGLRWVEAAAPLKNALVRRAVS
jgi:ubiquinone biosynthesis UbiH/UbiF/VisC/COQ6 family hydroxylase